MESAFRRTVDPMDDIEHLLRRYRPFGPPSELRERILDRARPAWSLLEWLPAAAALFLAAMFAWLAANERQMIDAHFTPVPPIYQTVPDTEDVQR